MGEECFKQNCYRQIELKGLIDDKTLKNLERLLKLDDKNI